VETVGESFQVYKSGDIDVSLPRRESKSGRGHRGFDIAGDPSMELHEAVRRHPNDLVLATTAADIRRAGAACAGRGVIRKIDLAGNGEIERDDGIVLRRMQFLFRQFR
jgi:hypothetical protein